MRHYVCTIFNDYTFDHDGNWLGDHSVPALQVAKTVVRARNKCEAAARAFVSTLGRVYARKLRELNAPQVCIYPYTDYRTQAECLGRAVNRLGPCFFFDNKAETWFIQVKLHRGVWHPQQSSPRGILSVVRQILLRQGLWSRSVN